MKMIKNAVTLCLGLIMIGSATFAQSLADAKKAINAEQYQKATAMLKSLTASQNKPENFFTLGNVYLINDDVDSAKIAFTAGVAADAKYAMNYVGLGNVDLTHNDPTAAKANFDKAISLATKDYKTYLQIGKAYLAQDKPNFAAALPFLTKADELDAKDLDAEVFIAIGDYYAAQKLNSDALGPYMRAIDIDATNLRPLVQIGRMYTRAINYVDAAEKLNEAIAIDPNYGPAYRELAETQMEWAPRDPARTKELQASALSNYRKYLDLTDKSFDTRLRYAQFLVYAGDFKTLEEVANGLALNNPNPNKALLISRLRGYAAFENGNYPQSLQFLNDVVSKAKQGSSSKLFASDYAYLGKAQLQANQDSLAVISLTKATEMDSTNADALVDVAKKYAAARNYSKAADIINVAIKAYPKSASMLTNQYYMAFYYYLDYYYKNREKLNPSKDILVKADSAYAYINRVSPETEAIYLGRAKVAQLMEADPSAPVGLAVPFYEQYIQLVTVTKPEKLQDPNTTKGLVEAYGYLGYMDIDKDKEKAKEYFNKVLELDPQNKSAQDNLKYLNPPPTPTPVKKAPIKK